jgi:hypothetical protein
MVHTLLPRSTGLQYILRTLTPRIPKLDVLDLTVAYPHIPPKAIPQEYYTLRSIFGARAPPPAVHIHVRRFRVARDIPIGEVSAADARRPPRGGSGAVEVDVPPAEKRAFEEWLRTVWRQKVGRLSSFSPAVGVLSGSGRTSCSSATMPQAGLRSRAKRRPCSSSGCAG